MTLNIDAGAKPSEVSLTLNERLAGLFASPGNTLVTLGIALLIALGLWEFLRWAITDATWSGGSEACRAHAGACWPFIGANARLMVFGVYPEWALWRAWVSLALMISVIGASMVPRLWGWPLALSWALTPAAVCALLSGVFTSTDMPKRSSSCGRNSPSSGLPVPTSTNRAGCRILRPSRSTTFSLDAATSSSRSTR